MPLSVMNSPGGGAMSNLLRQTRPMKSGDETNAAAASEPATAAARQGGRGTIDSTGSGTAQIKAALTLHLSPLAGQGDAAPEKTQARAVAAGSATAVPRTGAADLLRVLDAYAAEALRLSA